MPAFATFSLFPAAAGSRANAPMPSVRDGKAVVTLAGETVELLAGRALHWPRARAVFVADVHLGKAAAFRAGGVPISPRRNRERPRPARGARRAHESSASRGAR